MLLHHLQNYKRGHRFMNLKLSHQFLHHGTRVEKGTLLEVKERIPKTGHQETDNSGHKCHTDIKNNQDNTNK